MHISCEKKWRIRNAGPAAHSLNERYRPDLVMSTDKLDIYRAATRSHLISRTLNGFFYHVCRCSRFYLVYISRLYFHGRIMPCCARYVPFSFGDRGEGIIHTNLHSVVLHALEVCVCSLPIVCIFQNIVFNHRLAIGKSTR
jgi:hypothetical protein